jgi:Ca2+ transporting ATPase
MQAKVSVTGEGINDVDALREAQVGLAMGTGCPAAKDAAELVITDNNFQGCLQAVLWGRNIFQNVTRFLQFQLTCNLAMVLTIFIGMFFFGESPFSASQLLWINMIMDILSALALATEPPMASGVKGDPHNQTSLLKQPHIWRQIIGTALYMTIIMVLLFIFGGLATGSPKYYPYTNTANARIKPDDGTLCPDYPAQVGEEYFVYTTAQLAHEQCAKYIGANAKMTVLTYAFNTFCFMNLFNLINCRKLGASDKNIFERFLHNWTFIIVFLGAFVAHICLVQFLPVLLRTTDIETRGEWGGAIAVGASVLAIGILLKLTP